MILSCLNLSYLILSVCSDFNDMKLLCGGVNRTTHPDRRAVTMQSEQKRCRHSLVVMVFFSMSRQMGHISSLCRERGDTATSVPSMMASCKHSRVTVVVQSSPDILPGRDSPGGSGAARTGSAPRSYWEPGCSQELPWLPLPVNAEQTTRRYWLNTGVAKRHM